MRIRSILPFALWVAFGATQATLASPAEVAGIWRLRIDRNGKWRPAVVTGYLQLQLHDTKWTGKLAFHEIFLGRRQTSRKQR